jgi:apolipoprotein N-acyltransferase
MQIAQMRALENGRWLLRATNNGITAIVNDRGQIQAQLPQFEAAVLPGEFQVMTGRTPYSYLGDLPVLVVLLLLLVASVIRSASLADRAAKPRNFS